MAIKISALGDATTINDADSFAMVQSGITVESTAKLIREFIRNHENRWREIDDGNYTDTPASTSRITCSDTSDFAVGWPVRYTYNGSTYYGIITAVSAGAYIDIAGAPLDVAHDITKLELGKPEQVATVVLFVSGAYGDGANDLLANDMNTYEEWDEAIAYLVAFKGVHKTADTGASQPKVNIKVGGSSVSTNDSNFGIQLSTAGTQVRNSAVAINTSNYQINRGDSIEVNCSDPGTNGDAKNLTVRCQFVVP